MAGLFYSLGATVGSFRIGIFLSAILIAVYGGIMIGATIWDPPLNTELDKLWIDPDSSVAANNAYSDEFVTPLSSSATEANFFTGKDGTESVATEEALKCFQEVSQAVDDIVVTVEGKQYTTRDVCAIGGPYQWLASCYEFSTLDCWAEGVHDYPTQAAAFAASLQLPDQGTQWGVLLFADATYNDGAQGFQAMLAQMCRNDNYNMGFCPEKYKPGQYFQVLYGQTQTTGAVVPTEDALTSAGGLAAGYLPWIYAGVRGGYSETSPNSGVFGFPLPNGEQNDVTCAQWGSFYTETAASLSYLDAVFADDIYDSFDVPAAAPGEKALRVLFQNAAVSKTAFLMQCSMTRTGGTGVAPNVCHNDLGADFSTVLGLTPFPSAGANWTVDLTAAGITNAPFSVPLSELYTDVAGGSPAIPQLLGMGNCQFAWGADPSRCELCLGMMGLAIWRELMDDSVQLVPGASPYAPTNGLQATGAYPFHQPAGVWDAAAHSDALTFITGSGAVGATNPSFAPVSAYMFYAWASLGCSQVEATQPDYQATGNLPFNGGDLGEFCAELVVGGANVLYLFGVQTATCAAAPTSLDCLYAAGNVTEAGLALANYTGNTQGLNTTWLDPFYPNDLTRETHVVQVLETFPDEALYPVVQPYRLHESYVGKTEAEILSRHSKDCFPSDLTSTVAVGGEPGLLPAHSKTLLYGGTVPASVSLQGKTCTCDTGYGGSDCSYAKDDLCKCTSIEDEDCTTALFAGCGGYAACAGYTNLLGLLSIVPGADTSLVDALELGAVVTAFDIVGDAAAALTPYPGGNGTALLTTLAADYCQGALICVANTDYAAFWATISAQDGAVMAMTAALASTLYQTLAPELGVPTAAGTFMRVVKAVDDPAFTNSGVYVANVTMGFGTEILDGMPDIDPACAACQPLQPGPTGIESAACNGQYTMWGGAGFNQTVPGEAYDVMTAFKASMAGNSIPSGGDYELTCLEYFLLPSFVDGYYENFGNAVPAAAALADRNTFPGLEFRNLQELATKAEGVLKDTSGLTVTTGTAGPFAAAPAGALLCGSIGTTAALSAAAAAAGRDVADPVDTAQCQTGFIELYKQGVEDYKIATLDGYPAEAWQYTYAQNASASVHNSLLVSALSSSKSLLNEAKAAFGVSAPPSGVDCQGNPAAHPAYCTYLAAIDGILTAQCSAAIDDSPGNVGVGYVPPSTIELADCEVLFTNLGGALTENPASLQAIGDALGKYVIVPQLAGACTVGGGECDTAADCSNQGTCGGEVTEFTEMTSYASVMRTISAEKLQQNFQSSNPLLSKYRYWANKAILAKQDPPVDPTGTHEITLETAQAVIDAWRAAYGDIAPSSDECKGSAAASTLPSDSIDNLIEEYSGGSLVLILVGYILMIVYSAFALTRWSADSTILLNASDALVGATGVILVSVGLGAGLALSILLGIEFNATTTQVLPFIMLGLGVDDMFVLARTFPQYKEGVSASEATGKAMQIAGPSVTLTSLTNVGVFAIGNLARMPIVTEMATQSALIVACNFFMLIIVFPFVLSLNYGRKARGLVDCLPFVKVGTYQAPDGEEDRNCYNRSLAGAFSSVLLLPVVKIAILAVKVALLAVGLSGYFGSVTLGLSLSILTPETESTSQALDVYSEYFAFYAFNVYFKEADMRKVENQVGIPKVFEDVIATSKVLNVTNSAWFLGFINWGQTSTITYDNTAVGGVCNPDNVLTNGDCGEVNNCTIIMDATVTSYPYYAESDFYRCLQEWVRRDGAASLLGPGFKYVDPDVPTAQLELYYSSENKIPISTGNPLFAVDLLTNDDFITLIEETAAVTGDDTSPPSYVAGTPFSYWEQYPELLETINTAIAFSLLVAFGASAVLLIFVSDGDAGFGTKLVTGLWGAAIITAVIASMVYEIYGFCGYFDIRISAIPAISLIMSVGVGIEFTAHIVLAFINAAGDKNARVREALDIMLAPLVDGAITTFVGVVMLAFSELPFIVLYYFGLYCIIVVVGFLNGGLVLPVILSLVGPPSLAGAGDDDMSKSNAVAARA